MATGIIGLLVALVPLVVLLIRRHIAKKDDPENIRKTAQLQTDDAVARGDTDAVNTVLDDELRRLQAKGGRDRVGQSGDSSPGK
jgi:hypothetical protein